MNGSQSFICREELPVEWPKEYEEYHKSHYYAKANVFSFHLRISKINCYN